MYLKFDKTIPKNILPNRITSNNYFTIHYSRFNDNSKLEIKHKKLKYDLYFDNIEFEDINYILYQIQKEYHI